MRLQAEENEVNDDKSLNEILSCEISNMIVRHSEVLTAVTSVLRRGIISLILWILLQPKE